MFLVKDSSLSREKRIQQFFIEDPSLSTLLAVIHFEWTVRRAVIALGTSPNVNIRTKLKSCHGHKAYKGIWKEEVFPKRGQRLTEVVNNWDGLRKAFKLRHRLVHGVSACGAEYARDRTSWAIYACQNIRGFCLKHDIDLDSRLPIRQRPRK